MSRSLHTLGDTDKRRLTGDDETVAASFVAPSVLQMPPSGIRKFFDLISQTEGVISLGVGEPDFTTPWHIREAAIYRIERGHTNYTSNAGLPELRRAISGYLQRKAGIMYDWQDEILVTVGASEAIDLALRSVIQPGDEVIIPEPCFVSYAPCTVFAGGTPVALSLTQENGFQIKRQQLERAVTPRTKVILLSSPNNPTGAVLDDESLTAVAHVAREHNLLVLSDEIYSELVYDRAHRSIAAYAGMRERTVVINGLSKAYAMTGWRIGYAAGPKPIIGAMTKIHQYTIMCAPTLSQQAAVEALNHGDHEQQRMTVEYNRRRRVMLSGLLRMGLDCFEAQGAFYLFPSIRRTGLDDETFAERLLLEEKVAVVPGSAFGPSGAGHVRCSYATNLETLQEALRRMERFVSKLIRS